MKKKDGMCSSCKKKVMKHIKGDMKSYQKEYAQDKDLMHELNKSKKRVTKHKYPKPKTNKVRVVMEEFKEGNLHSGSKNGPLVTNPDQAIAIGISEAKRKRKK